MSPETAVLEMETVRPNTIPDDYSAIGVTRGFRLPPIQRTRFLLVGMPGEGKSSFAASNPDALILDWDCAAEQVEYQHSMRVAIRNMAEYRRVHEKLVQDAKSGRFVVRHIVHDTIDKAQAAYAQLLAEERNVEVLEEYGIKGAGYSVLRRAILRDLTELYSVGYGWTVIGHLKETTITVNGADQTVLREAMYPGLAIELRRDADYLMTVYGFEEEIPIMKDVKVGKEVKTIRAGSRRERKVRLSLSASQLRYGKFRVDILPDGLDLPKKGGWGKFQEAYEAARVRLEAEHREQGGLESSTKGE